MGLSLILLRHPPRSESFLGAFSFVIRGCSVSLRLGGEFQRQFPGSPGRELRRRHLVDRVPDFLGHFRAVRRLQTELHPLLHDRNDVLESE